MSIWPNFHFLRPMWLLALLPLAWLGWGLLRSHGNSAVWQRLCDHHLLPHLLVAGTRTRRYPIVFLLAAWVLAVFALAGPAWSKLPQPVFRAATARVIVLDLSVSMNATDVRPSRLALAKFKVRDILNRSREGQTGLVVYAGAPYIVSPLTEDAATIAALIPVLGSDLMPVQGSNPAAALRRADTLLEQAGVSDADVILLTDGIDADDDLLEIARDLRTQGHRLSVLAVGTEAGAPIPAPSGGFVKDRDGGIVISRVDTASMRRLVDAGGGRLAIATVGDGDLDMLVSSEVTSTRRDQSAENRTSDAWQEEGPWLLLALLPLGAIAFRRGWVGCFLLLTMGLPTPGYPLDVDRIWGGLWLRPEQQAQRAFNEGRHADAAARFEDPERRAAAQFRSGDFAAAAELYATRDSSDAHYNRGNALAKSQQLEEALKAYDNALARDPAHADARHNRELVEELLKEQQSEKPQETSNPENSSQENSKADSDKEQQDPSGEDGGQPENQDPQASNQPQNQPGDDDKDAAKPGADEKEPEQPDDGSKSSASAEDDSRDAEPQEKDEKNDVSDSEIMKHLGKQESEQEQGASPETSPQPESLSESQQALEQWMRKVPDDPGGLLRRKFLLEHRREQMRAGNRPINEKPW